MAKPLVLITGASQGIGAALAHVFASQLKGCRLALVARSATNLEKVAEKARRIGSTSVETFSCDVTDARAVDKMATQVGERCGPVDVLINNAGVFRGASFLDTTVAQFDELVAVNLRSVFLVSKAFVPAMVKRGRGDIFNMSSIAGKSPYPNGSGYCAAKFGVSGLTQVMRQELRDKGVRVTLVCPGATVSPSWKDSGVDPERLMPAEDVARAFYDVYQLTRRTVVEEIILRPQLGDL